MSPSPERTYLRVRRKRSTCAAAEILRLRGLDSHHHHHHHSDDTNENSNKKRVAVWRRVEDHHNETTRKKRSYRVVDAVLEEEELPDDHTANVTRSSPERKRPRLTLLATSETSDSNKNKKNGMKILNPAERMVDDSLQQVFQGNRPVAEHYQFLLTDPRLADQWRRWCAWYNDECGNILHACALWNDYEIMDELLRILMASSTTCRYDSLLLNRIDREGRTPYQIADMCKHEQVCQILESYGAGDYLVDLYALEDADMTAAETISYENDDLEDERGSRDLACDLRGGVGYWNDKGQLVLQQSLPHTMSDVTLRDEDESIDSNHEDWDGNDYPDFEEAGYVENGIYDEDDSEHAILVADDEEGDAFGAYPPRRRHSPAVVDDHGDFDAAYGVYGQRDVEEYDYEL
jgi:hypothetical protein